MFGPDQSLDIDLPPTRLLAVDQLIARRADAGFAIAPGFAFGLTSNPRSTLRQYPLPMPNPLAPHPLSLFLA